MTENERREGGSALCLGCIRGVAVWTARAGEVNNVIAVPS
jgi:hypothetical protein